MKTNEIDYRKNYIRVESNYAGAFIDGPLSAAIELCDNWDQMSPKERYQFVDAAYDQYCCPEMNGYLYRNEALVICGELETCALRYIARSDVIDLSLAQLDANGMLLHVWEANDFQTVENFIEWSGLFDEEDPDAECIRLESVALGETKGVTIEFCGDAAWTGMSEAQRVSYMSELAFRFGLKTQGDLMITDGLRGSVSLEFACALTPEQLREEGYVTIKHWNLCGQTDEDYALEQAPSVV